MVKHLRVLFEDNHLLIVDKPPLLATMGVAKDQPSLLKLAKEYVREKYHKPGNVYLGVVSRLDAFASGAIIFARTSKAAARLSKQFRDGIVKKTYWSILPGPLDPPYGTLEHWVLKNEPRHRMEAWPEKRDGSKLARLAYKTLGKHKSRSLVEIQLETGRKHQIRVQFSQINRPIVGDRKYGSQEFFPRGIALHCRSLQFEHPTQKSMIRVTSDPPNCWNLSRFGIS